jgi:hypothetical protein
MRCKKDQKQWFVDYSQDRLVEWEAAIELGQPLVEGAFLLQQENVILTEISRLQIRLW